VGKLTKSEFEELLKRAAERDVETGPRNFTSEELLEAGSELGISRDALLEVWREHEAKVARAAATEAAAHAAAVKATLLPRPRGTRVKLWRSHERLILQYRPRLAARITSAVTVVLAGGFALLSLRAGWPLNLAGALTAALLGGLALVAGHVVTRLELQRGGGRLSRRVGPLGYTRQLTIPGLVVRLEQELRQRQGVSHTARYVALDDGTRTHQLLVDYSVPEQRWIASELYDWLYG
jgi:hypothetical protein